MGGLAGLLAIMLHALAIRYGVASRMGQHKSGREQLQHILGQ
jgi:hypothetical protein